MSQPHSPLDALRIHRKAAPEPKPMLWRVAVVLTLLAVTAVVWWWFLPKAVLVQTAEARGVARDGEEHTVLNASGYVTARREATVSSKVTGKVVDVLIEEGMKVKAGQVLARLDDTNVKANLDVAAAQLDSRMLPWRKLARKSSRQSRNFSASPSWPSKKSHRNRISTWQSQMPGPCRRV